MLKVKLPDGSVKEYSRHVRPCDVAAEIGPGLAKATLAAVVDGKVVGADAALPAQGQVSLRLLTKKDAEALGVMRHSCAHIMARAVMRLFDGVQLAFGPTLDNGFYYDFELPHKLTESDFPAIEAEMAKHRQAQRAVRADRRAARKGRGDLPRPASAPQGRAYHRGPGRSSDVCRSIAKGNSSICAAGRMFPRAGAIGAFKLLSVAGAYWKGDASRQQLQRVYATAFFSQAELDERSENGRRGQTPRPSRPGQAVGTVRHQSR